VVLGKQGRLVIPAELRTALGLEPGDELNLQRSGTSLVIQRPEDAIAELRGFLGDAAKDGRSLVDELIAERRAEAARE